MKMELTKHLDLNSLTFLLYCKSNNLSCKQDCTQAEGSSFEEKLNISPDLCKLLGKKN